MLPDPLRWNGAAWVVDELALSPIECDRRAMVEGFILEVLLDDGLGFVYRMAFSLNRILPPAVMLPDEEVRNLVIHAKILVLEIGARLQLSLFDLVDKLIVVVEEPSKVGAHYLVLEVDHVVFVHLSEVKALLLQVILLGIQIAAELLVLLGTFPIQALLNLFY